MEVDMYKIGCNDLDVKFNYVGSTTNFMMRKSRHKSNSHDIKYGQQKLYKIINENGGWNCWYMDIIETCICESKLDARIRERYWYEKLNASLNTYRPMLTSDETKEYMAEWNRQYYNDNKDEIKERQKEYQTQYYIDNKIAINEKVKQYKNNNNIAIQENNKQYQINNKEKIAEYQKQYKIDNKETIATRKSEKIHCEACEIHIVRGDITRHNKSPKHLANLTKLQNTT